MSLRAKVRAAFTITGRGTAVVLENRFEGNARRDETVDVPIVGSARRGLRVRSVEIVDGRDEKGEPTSWVAVLFAAGEVTPDEIEIGGELRTPEFAN